VLARFELRRLSGKDASAYRQIRLQALHDHPDAFEASWQDERELSEARFAERLDNGHVIGGFDESSVLVGTVGLFLSGGAKRQHIASVWGMYVSSVARGKGLARQLLDAILADVGPSVRSVRLGVEAANEPAIRLYESVGFRQWALETEALRIGDAFHDEILMRLDLVSE
jgi:ribosomal protein S18 acetylase RimI-like enzyme